MFIVIIKLFSIKPDNEKHNQLNISYLCKILWRFIKIIITTKGQS